MALGQSNREPAYFDPAQPPPDGHDAGVSAEIHGAGEMHAWAEVKAHHDRLQAAIATLAGESPALYAPAAQDDTGRLADMAAAPADEARQAMAATLRELLENIRATMPKLGGDLDDRDLTPLHDRLFQGVPGASGTSWSNPLHQSIAREVVEGHEDAQFWLSLGLGTAAAAAFVVAELATFVVAELATFGGARRREEALARAGGDLRRARGPRQRGRDHRANRPARRQTSSDIAASDAAGASIEQAARQGESAGALVTRDAANHRGFARSGACRVTRPARSRVPGKRTLTMSIPDSGSVQRKTGSQRREPERNMVTLARQ